MIPRFKSHIFPFCMKKAWLWDIEIIIGVGGLVRMKEKSKEILDWEYMDDYYDNPDEERKVKSLEEYMAENSQDIEERARRKEEDLTTMDDELAKTVLAVKRVREAFETGFDVEKLMETYGYSKEYINLIVMTLQGYTEDNDFAVAHLVLMG